MILFDFRNITVFVSLLIHLFLLMVFFRYGKKNRSNKAYTLAILAIVAWVFPMVLYRSHFLGHVEFWARLLYAFATFTSSSFFYFAFVFPDNKNPSFFLKLFLFLETFFAFWLAFHPTWLISSVEINLDGEDAIIWGPLYILFFIHIAGWFSSGFFVLYKKLAKFSGQKREQIRSILVGYFLGSNLAMVTNLTLPWYGYFDLNWLGQFFSTLVAAFTTYAIYKYSFLNVKVLATEAFVLGLNFLFLFQLFSTTGIAFIINLVILILLLIVSFLLVNSVKKEVNKNEELHKLAINLNKANQRLQLLDRQKTEFLSIASHQLRTPLSIIKGYGELIRDGAYGEVTDQVKHVLTDMDDSNERLVKLVDEFLNITRIEQGRTKYTFEMSDLNETIDSIVAELKPKAEKNDTKIIWKPTKRKRMYCFDEEKVRHIIFNFVDNAIKYGKGTPVHVKVKPENGGVSVRITDKGMGFDKEDGANFFNKFYRGKNVQGTNVNGTGLGIYVCKQFAEAHRGKVWADSPGLGKGSEFGFFMPKLDPKHPPKPKIDKDKQFVVNQYGGESLSDEIKAVL